MQYIVLAFILILSVAFFYKVTQTKIEPDFRLKGAVNTSKLSFVISSLAANHKNCASGGSGLSIVLIKKYIVKAYKIISQKAKLGQEILPLENYIYDNFYKLNKELADLKKDKALAYKLPHYYGAPRAYQLISLLIKTNEGFIDAKLLEFACSAYCAVTPLNFTEICAVKYLIKYSLMEYIAIFCAKISVMNNKICCAKADASDNKINFNYLKFNSYAYGYSQANSPALQKFKQACINNGKDYLEQIDNFYMTISKYNGMLCAAFGSLFDLDSWLSDEFVLKLSPMYDFFISDNSTDFTLCTTQTKYLYFYQIALMAIKKKTSETAVLREIIFKSNSAKSNVAHFILPAVKGKKTMVFYIGFFCLVAVVLGCLLPLVIKKYLWLYLPLFAPILLAVSAIIVNSILKSFVKRRVMPAYDLKKVDGIKCRTAIVVPTLVASEAEIEQSWANLQTLISANNSDIFTYCLLLDFASTKNSDSAVNDKIFTQKLQQLYDDLQTKNNVCIIVRGREKVDGEDKYQGWEKKRGAIIQLNKYILTGKHNFMFCAGELNSDINFVVTLDSDTLTNSCASLVQIMLHPYNKNKTIVSVGINATPSSANQTAFSRLFCASVGVDNYGGYLSDLEYDIFGSGNYTGKGIYRVREFDQQLATAFMPNRILSHDYLEGAWAGCGNSNERALDNFPKNYSQFLGREIRWLRGDWQLLPYILPRVKNADGDSVKNRLSVIAKWHIFCNMFFSMQSIASLLLILLSFWAANPVVIILLAFSAQILRAFLGLRQLFCNFKQAMFEIFRQLFCIAVIPTVAISYLYAIVITLWRLASKKNLLQWSVFAHSGATVSFVPNAITTIIIVSTTLVFGFGWGYYLLGLIFLSGILINYLLSQPIKKKQKYVPELLAILAQTARRTLEYFDNCATKEFNYLPCDNYQQHLNVGFCNRTSPTNIGMYLLAYISAYELKIIDEEILLDKIQKTITSVEKLEKWQGNLYNWIDVTTLLPLKPRYVSTVDSGNFLACLMAASAYCSGELKNRINDLIQNTNIGALLDAKRDLFFIGYNTETGSFDTNHYDLLGSESALTYLVAVGLGKASKQAYNNLSRQHVKYKGSSLYSWTGGMFEYLMSKLFFSFSEGTLMQSGNTSVVKSQIYYAKKQKLCCYGISECQNNFVDDSGNYQYKAYGVPFLAHSNIGDTSIIAPYASFLTLDYAPLSVLQNTRAMENLGMFGKFGFYESFDGKTFVAQKAYMTHHQGMILASIANYVTGGNICKKLQTLPAFRAANLLLCESGFAKATKKITPAKPLKSKNIAPLKCVNTKDCYVNLLTNGKYNLITTTFGGGYSYYNNKIITEFDYDGEGCSVFARINNKDYKLNCGEFTGDSCSSVYQQTSSMFFCSCDTRVLSFIDGHVSHVSFTSFDKRKIEFASFAPLALNSINGHMSHPLYSKMFVQTGIDSSKKFMWAKRNDTDDLIVAHFIVCDFGDSQTKIEYEGNKTNLFSRARNKQISFGRVLEPVLSASFSAVVMPSQKINFYVVNLVSNNYEKLKSMVELCGSAGYFERQQGASDALGKSINISLNTKLIASKLLYGSGGSIKCSSIDGLNMRRPIISILISGENQIAALTVKLNQLKKLYAFGISFNLVILYKEKHNYYLRLTDLVCSCVNDSGIESLLSAESTFKIVNAEQDDVTARLILNNSININDLSVQNLPAEQTPSVINPQKNAPLEFYQVRKPMGIGGYTKQGDYCMDISAIDTPSPWSNIISDGEFGTLVTESGGGYTFGANSREHRLTKWSNDPLQDEPSEYIILAEQGLKWSVTKKPICTESNYYCLHALGYSEYKNNYNSCISVMRQYIAVGHESKIYEISLTNTCKTAREISVSLALNLVLGDFKLNTMASSHSQQINNYCVRAYNTVSKINAYINCSNAVNFSVSKGITCLTTTLTLLPSVSQSVVFSLGLDNKIDLSRTDEYFSDCCKYFQSVSNIEICDDNDFKYLLKWLPYQVLCARFNGRTGFYQSSGAYGFRDQLQDCLTLLYINPKTVRAHILECATHQFVKGDVMHWWHAPATGVRTKICDDRLFLPYLVAEYISFTHDYAIVAERAPFLQDVQIGEHDASVYSSPQYTTIKASILEHCIKAIDVSLDFGADGLVKMRGGDWNDAMDKVGEQGKGSSVWCSMFLYFVIQKFLPLVNDKVVIARFCAAQESLIVAIDNSWEGDRFARAYTDDGRVLGAEKSEECKIDLLCQAWATLGNCASPDKKKIALNTAADLLVDKKNKIIKLLSPPFKNMDNIGYISSYPQGVRENGGQYTHAAIWFIMSYFLSQKNNEAYQLLNLINPMQHTQDLEGVDKYFVEPYVIAADVYAGDFMGRGGWSWYTGSASWLYKCLVENLLGIKFNASKLTLSPNLPDSIQQLNIKVNTAFGKLDILIDNSGKKGDWRVKVGQVSYNCNSFAVSAQLIGKKIVVKRVSE